VSSAPFSSARGGFLAALAPVPTAATPTPPPAAPPSAAAPSSPAPPDSQDTDTRSAGNAPAPDPESQDPPAQGPSSPTPRSPSQSAPTQAQPSGGSQRHATSSSDGAALGLLSIICIPGCDQVYDNGKLLGASPVFKRPATLGSHKIRLVTSNPHAEKIVSTIVVADSVAVVRESMQ
jgi:hypothetical protein